ncbi:thiol reductant ABC exporter subunit CydD [Microbacterium sp. 1P10UB]|uniref:thiol reductant ABC exporter subunit CydD n=1 Tax=unclassified Microbacterium TaxID=2609290 RepID=UPI0039A15698
MSDPAAPVRLRPVDPRLLRHARASHGFFVAAALLGVAQTAAVVAFAALLTRAIVGVVEGMPPAKLAGTLTLLALVVGARALLAVARDSVAARASAKVQTQLRDGLLSAVGTLGPQWLAGQNSARLAVTAGRGLESLDPYFARYLPQLVQTALATPALLAVMWWQDWLSGLTVLVTLPLIPVFMVLIGWATRSIQSRQWQTLSLLAARFADTVQGLGTLKVYGRQHRAAASIDLVTDRYRRETMRVLRVSFLSGFALEFLASISVAVVAVSIGFRLLDGSLALGVGLFVLLLAPEAYLPLRQVGVQFHAAAEGVAATDDVFSVMDAAAAVRASEPVAHSALRSAGALDVRDVRVRRGDHLLPPVSFALAPGSVVLLDGASGSGKSSVLAALRGAADFDGEATFAGTDVRRLRSADWLAWAGQTAGLLSGTIAENVALGEHSPDPALVRRALMLAGAGELDPERALGVQGAGLSGGQAQRVAVARAVHRHLAGRAPVIALDEPSAALDADTEARRWASLRRLADDGAAVLLVSHRPSARTIADRVVSLDRAEVPA